MLIRNLQQVVVDFIDERLARFPGPIEDARRTSDRSCGTAPGRRRARRARLVTSSCSVRSRSIRPACCKRSSGLATPMIVAGNSAGSAARTRGRVALTSCQDAIPQPRSSAAASTPAAIPTYVVPQAAQAARAGAAAPDASLTPQPHTQPAIRPGLPTTSA